MTREKTKKRIADALMNCGQEIFLALLESVKVEPVANARMLYSRRDAAEILGVSPSQIDNWRREGLLMAVTAPGSSENRYTKRNIDQFIRTLEKPR